MYVPLWYSDYARPYAYSVDPNGWICNRVGGSHGPLGVTMDGNDYITVGPATSKMDVTTGDFTSYAWIKTASATNQGILGKVDGVLFDGWYWRVKDNGLLGTYLDDGVSNELVSSVNVNTVGDGAWHFCGISWVSATDTVIFVKDIVRESIVATDAPYGSLTSGVVFRMGVNATELDMYLTGSIGEAWHYDRVLGPAEAQHIYYTTRWRYQ